jgi:hypothetical protein
MSRKTTLIEGVDCFANTAILCVVKVYLRLA